MLSENEVRGFWVRDHFSLDLHGSHKQTNYFILVEVFLILALLWFLLIWAWLPLFNSFMKTNLSARKCNQGKKSIMLATYKCTDLLLSPKNHPFWFCAFFLHEGMKQSCTYKKNPNCTGNDDCNDSALFLRCWRNKPKLFTA